MRNVTGETRVPSLIVRVAGQAGEAHPGLGDGVVGVVDGEQVIAPEHRRVPEILREPGRFEQVGILRGRVPREI